MFLCLEIPIKRRIISHIHRNNVLDNAAQQKAQFEIDNLVFQHDSAFFAQFVLVLVGTAANNFIDRFNVLSVSYYLTSINKPETW